MDLVITLILWGGIICLAVFLFQMFMAVIGITLTAVIASIIYLFNKVTGRE